MDVRNRQVGNRGGRVLAGLFLLLVGGILLLDQMGFPFPDWLFTWHVLLIAIGVFIGLRHNFRGGGWIILILIGGFFLIEDQYPYIPFHRFFWPGILILIGLVIIIRPHGGRNRGAWTPEQWEQWKTRKGFYSGPYGQDQYYNKEDFINLTSIFGGIQKRIVTKNFQGGDITTIMGGSELDFSQADFNGIVRLEVTQVMGGTKVIVPSHWEVRSEITAVFAGFEDKRQQPGVINPDKVLILSGTSIMGGIELKNY